MSISFGRRAHRIRDFGREVARLAVGEGEVRQRCASTPERMEPPDTLVIRSSLPTGRHRSVARSNQGEESRAVAAAREGEARWFAVDRHVRSLSLREALHRWSQAEDTACSAQSSSGLAGNDLSAATASNWRWLDGGRHGCRRNRVTR